MRKKTKTVGGKNAYAVNISMAVTDIAFASALADEELQKRNKGKSILTNLTKTKAKEILEGRLYHYGIAGQNSEYENVDFLDELNGYYNIALKWVHKNYPFLINSPTP